MPRPLHHLPLQRPQRVHGALPQLPQRGARRQLRRRLARACGAQHMAPLHLQHRDELRKPPAESQQLLVPKRFRKSGRTAKRWFASTWPCRRSSFTKSFASSASMAPSSSQLDSTTQLSAGRLPTLSGLRLVLDGDLEALNLRKPSDRHPKDIKKRSNDIIYIYIEQNIAI